MLLLGKPVVVSRVYYIPVVKWLIGLRWSAHGRKVTAGANDFGEVRNPIPHVICIVSKINGSETNSPSDLPILADAMRINNAYVNAG